MELYTDNGSIEAINRALDKFAAHAEVRHEIDSLKLDTATELHNLTLDVREARSRNEIKMAKAGRRAGYFSEAFAFFIICSAIEFAHDARLMAGRFETQLRPISERIQQVKTQFGLHPDEDWDLNERPDEYQLLNEEYDKTYHATLISTFRDFDEAELADLLEQDPERFDQLRETGRREIFEDISEVEHLRSLLAQYRNEVDRCAQAEAYYAACALVGACLETSLLLLCQLYPATVLAAKKSMSAPPKGADPGRWGLDKLIGLADTAGWLPSLGIGDYTLHVARWIDFIKEMRNLLHPGRHLREMPKAKIARQEFEDAAAALLIFDGLFKYLEQSAADIGSPSHQQPTSDRPQ